MENVMTDVMYEIPSDNNIARCTITKEAVEEGCAPVVEYRTEKIPETKQVKKKKDNGDIA